MQVIVEIKPFRQNGASFHAQIITAGTEREVLWSDERWWTRVGDAEMSAFATCAERAWTVREAAVQAS